MKVEIDQIMEIETIETEITEIKEKEIEFYKKILLPKIKQKYKKNITYSFQIKIMNYLIFS